MDCGTEHEFDALYSLNLLRSPKTDVVKCSPELIPRQLGYPNLFKLQSSSWFVSYVGLRM